MTPAEKFNLLTRLAKTGGVCMICHSGVEKPRTGRPRVLCKNQNCKSEYQSLYYRTFTKPERAAEAKEKRELARLADEKSRNNVIDLADFFSSEADTTL